MKNQQKPTPVDRGDGTQLQVNSMFHTVQGEGPFAGKPAVFIRLSGCNLQCPACDTEYTLSSTKSVREIMSRASILATGGTRLAVITGGEPFRQNIRNLSAALISYGWTVQVETNGKLPVPDSDSQWWSVVVERQLLVIVVSPKTATVWPGMWNLASAVKYVVHKDRIADDGLPTTALDHPLPVNADRVARPPDWWSGAVYVNPEDSQNASVNKKNMQAALEAVMMYDDPRRILGVQMHKLYGVE